MFKRIKDVCEGISKTHEVEATLRHDPGYPATVNTPEQTEKVRASAIKVVSYDLRKILIDLGR